MTGSFCTDCSRLESLPPMIPRRTMYACLQVDLPVFRSEVVFYCLCLGAEDSGSSVSQAAGRIDV